MQDNKSLCAAVMICAALVNTQTHTDTQHSTSYSISSTDRAKPSEYALFNQLSWFYVSSFSCYFNCFMLLFTA